MQVYVRNESDKPLDIWWGRDRNSLDMHEGQVLPHEEKVIHEAEASRVADFRQGDHIWVKGKAETAQPRTADMVVQKNRRNVCELK